MKNEKIHSTLLGLVGGYLLYLAWQLFESYRAGTGEMPEAAFIIAIVVFTVAGAGILVYAWTIYRKQQKTEKNQKERSEEQDPV